MMDKYAVVAEVHGLDPARRFIGTPGSVASAQGEFLYCVDCKHIRAHHGIHGCSACDCDRWVP